MISTFSLKVSTALWSYVTIQTIFTHNAVITNTEWRLILTKAKVWKRCCVSCIQVYYPIIPNRSTGCLDKSAGGGYIRFREPGATVTNMIYKRNWSSKLGGASIRGSAFIGDNTVFHMRLMIYTPLMALTLKRTFGVFWDPRGMKSSFFSKR